MDSRKVLDEPLPQATPPGFALDEVEVRLAHPHERVQWDALMNHHHYLGFTRFAGRGLRYLAVWRGRWLALAGWQGAALKCAPRDRWIGWRRPEMFRRLHLVANNTRFVVLGQRGVFPNLASRMMAAMLRQLSSDWQQHYGHPLLVAESFVDPQRFSGTLYQAGNWTYVGDSKGYARSNGHYTDPHGHPKRLFVRPLRRDARRILSQPGKLPDCWRARPEHPDDNAAVDKRSLYAELEDLPDYRRGQGRKHSIATVLTVYLLAALGNFRGPVAAAEYAQRLTQKDLKDIGAWRNRRTGRYHPPPKSTIHRVLMHADTEHLEAILQRYSESRLPPPAPRQRRAIAADGKRIRGANRHGSLRYETATLVEHGTGVPLASLNFHDENGELAAVGALLETVSIGGAVITLDALHTTRDTATNIVEQHQAHYQMTVKQNSSETYEALVSIPWEHATARFSTASEKAHGRIERRHIEVMTLPPNTLNYPHVAQVFRVRRDRHVLKSGEKTVTYAYGITSVPASEASAEQLLAWNRGHWAIESKNHHRRDRTLAEDACLARRHAAPANRAVCNNLVLALILRYRRWTNLASALRYFTGRPKVAIKALMAPG